MGTCSPEARNGMTTSVTRITVFWHSLDPNLRLLLVIGFIEAAALYAFSPVLMPYYVSLGFDSKVAGRFNSVEFAATCVVALVGGLVADMLGRKRLYVAGQLIRLAMILLLLSVTGYVGLLIVAMLRGLVAVQLPAQSALLASYTSPSNRATVIGISQTLSQVAGLLIPLAVGFLADAYGVRVPFCLALTLAAGAIIVTTRLKERSGTTEPAGSAERQASRRPFLAAVSEMFSGPRWWVLALLLVARLSNGLANGALNILMPFTIMDRFSRAYAVMSTAQVFFSLGTIVVLLVGGRLADLKGRRAVAVTAGFIFPLLICSLPLAKTLWQLFPLLMLVTMAASISSPAVQAIQMEAVGERHRATFMGLAIGLNYLGMALGSFVAGITYTVTVTWSWAGMVTLYLLPAVIFHIILPREQKTTSQAKSVR